MKYIKLLREKFKLCLNCLEKTISKKVKIEARNCLQKAIIRAEAGVNLIKIEEKEVALKAIKRAMMYLFKRQSGMD